ncbi:MAG: hypothetical protein IJ048_02030, partial [Clostridia bacterium]|nr:hypothetical protein [Clostridia bacterium]
HHTASGETAALRVRPQAGLIHVRIVQDVHAVELYAGSGESMLCLAHMSDLMLNRVACEGARITAWALSDIHA